MYRTHPIPEIILEITFLPQVSRTFQKTSKTWFVKTVRYTIIPPPELLRFTAPILSDEFVGNLDYNRW